VALPQTKKTDSRANVGPLFRFSGIGPGMADTIELGGMALGQNFQKMIGQSMLKIAQPLPLRTCDGVRFKPLAS
jgi:hypothetical protein